MVGDLLDEVIIKLGEHRALDLVHRHVKGCVLAGELLRAIVRREGDAHLTVFAGFGAVELFGEAGHEAICADFGRVVLGRSTLERLAFDEAFVVHRDGIAVLHASVLDRLEQRCALAQRIYAVVNFFFGHHDRGALGGYAAIIGKVYVGPDGDLGFDAQAKLIVRAIQVDVRAVDRLELVLFERLGVNLGHEVLKRLAVDAALADVLFEDLAWHVACAEAWQLVAGDEFTICSVLGLREICEGHFYVKLDLGGSELAYGCRHRNGVALQSMGRSEFARNFGLSFGGDRIEGGPATHGARSSAGWSGRRDSNSRPSPWQGDALPLSYFRVSTSAVSYAHDPIILAGESAVPSRKSPHERQWIGVCRLACRWSRILGDLHIDHGHKCARIGRERSSI